MDNLSGKTKAVIAYISFVGLGIAYFLNKEDKHEFTTWHIKNMFGLFLLLLVSIAMQDFAIGIYIYLTTVALWLYSLIMCIMNKQQGIPLLSEKFQTWFKFLN